MEFSVSFRYQSGEEHNKEPLLELKVATLHELKFFRRAWTTRRQHNTPGLFFFSSTGQLVYHESHLERQVLLVEDFEQSATCVIAQPFEIQSEERRHVPDLLVVSEQNPKVIDVRHSKFAETSKFQVAREAMYVALAQLGWKYEVRTEPEKQFFTNLDWLSGYRRIPPDFEFFAPLIIGSLEAGAKSFADLFRCIGNELFSQPVVFHLLWLRILEIDLYAPLTSETKIDLARGLA